MCSVVIFAILFVRYNYFFHISNDYFGSYQIVAEWKLPRSEAIVRERRRREFSIPILCVHNSETKVKNILIYSFFMGVKSIIGGDLTLLPHIYIRIGTSWFVEIFLKWLEISWNNEEWMPCCWIVVHVKFGLTSCMPRAKQATKLIQSMNDWSHSQKHGFIWPTRYRLIFGNYLLKILIFKNCQFFKVFEEGCEAIQDEVHWLGIKHFSL